MNARKISFFETRESIFTCNYNSPSVSISIKNNDCTLHWLLDTGASISAIEYKYIKRYKIPIHKEITAINGLGGSVETIGYVCLNLQYKENIFSHRFFVFHSLPCRANGILGDDFFRKYYAILNYEHNTLSLLNDHSERIIFTFSTLKNKDDSVWTIPSRSESIHYIKTNLIGDYVVCSRELCEGVFLASSIVTPVHGKIPIRILNTTEENVTLNSIEPDICKLQDYYICSFERTESNSKRVKKLFSLLKLGGLNSEERISIERLCAKFSDIFYLPGDKLTTTDIYEQSISLKPNTEPIYTKSYRLPYVHKGELKKQLDKMLSEGIIEPSKSEWSSPVLLVPKKSNSDGERKWRLVIDYRKLNNVIQDDKFPLPNITEVLDSLSGSVYFSHLDLNSSYYQVSLHPNSRKYTAFCSGQFQMTRMPMGLKTSPSAFSRMMNIAMSGLNHEKCLVYLDDLVIFGKNLFDHNKNLLDVFTRLRTCNLKLNAEKCNFLQKKLLYLGHIVSENGVLPDPEKIKVLKMYPTPTNTDEVKRFVAFANYYRKFIKNFAEIAYPLNSLCKKNQPFNWDDNCEKSFLVLKDCLSQPPVLQYPDFSVKNNFVLQTDASGVAIGAILSNQDRKPVSFASRTLNKAEKRYPTIEKELLAIVWAVKHFRPYLYGRTFTILTDHKPLIYLFNMRDPSSRLMKFRLMLEDYDYNIEYVKGSENIAADALSRIVISSNELKEMSEMVINVMTRRQKKCLETSSLGDACFNKNLSKTPKIIETHFMPRKSVELRFTNKSDLDKLKCTIEIQKESSTFSYVPKMGIILINPSSQSQLTPSAFVRELEEFCKSINIEEVCVIKNENNHLFIKKIDKCD